MGHERRPHTRRYPMVNGYRKPGRVRVRGSHVNDSDSDGGAGACGCIVLIAIGWAVVKAVQWIGELFN